MKLLIYALLLFFAFLLIGIGFFLRRKPAGFLAFFPKRPVQLAKTLRVYSWLFLLLGCSMLVALPFLSLAGMLFFILSASFLSVFFSFSLLLN